MAFVLLAYALSWWAWFWHRADPGNVGAPILPAGPLIAALVLLPILGGLQAVRELLGRIVLWRVGWRWYVVALGLPVLLTSLAAALNILLGARPYPDFDPPDPASVVMRFAFILVFIGLGEEPGWRGFLLPRLLSRQDALRAAMTVGLIHMVWHLPLYGHEYDMANVTPWGISVFCFSVVITWVYLHTGGSVLLPMLMHASNNTAAVMWQMFGTGDQLRLWWVWCGLWVAVAVAVVGANGRDLKSQTDDPRHGG